MIQRGKAVAPGGFACVKVGLGVQKIGIDQTGKQQTYPECKACYAARDLTQVGGEFPRIENGGRWLGVLGLLQFNLAIGLRQPLIEATIPIVQPRMMARDQVSQYTSCQFAVRTMRFFKRF